MNAAVETLTPESAPAVVDVFCDAFLAYPIMRFVLGEEAGTDPATLQTLIGLFVGARALRNEPLLGIRSGPGLAAAATLSFPGLPGAGESPPDFAVLREETWEKLGDDARSRYETCGEVWARLGVDEPHIHLNMIGVRRAHQGQGLARLLLRSVHDLALSTPQAKGVTLTTEDPVNVEIYRSFGYTVVGSAAIAPTLETWSMYRENRHR